ncbi:dTMP kinase [Chloroflexota bacterium]
MRQALALFVTFEGGEGSGKSIQARALYKRVSEYGIPVTLSQEPGGTSLGIKARRLLKQRRDTEISPLAELFLFAASRAQLVVKVVRPSLERGTMVICDRYAASTVAYQGYGRGLDLNSIQTINTIATQNLLPDLVILLDIPVEIGLARKGSVENDRFDSEEVFFHQRVREGYIEMAASDPKRWLVVDASLPRREVERIIWERVEGLLQNEA